MFAMSTTIAETVQISQANADRLTRLADDRHVTEDTLVEKALELLFSLTAADSTANERQHWANLSETSLNKVWDNDMDTVYDNWRELYGIQEG
jgi:hypothetical protein